MKVGELFGLVGLDTDEFDDGLVRVERRMQKADVDRDAELGIDDSNLQSGARQAEGRLDDVTRKRTAEVDVDADTSKAVSEVRGAESDVSSAIEGWSDGIAGAAGVVGAAAGAYLVDGLVDYVENDKAGDRIAAVLNLPKAADDQMRRVAERLHEGLSVDTKVEGLEAVGAVIGTFKQLGDVGDAELERLASDLHAVAQAAGASDDEIALSAQTLFSNHLVPTYQAGLDLMAGMMGSVAPELAGDMLDIFNEGEYLEFFQRMNYSSEEMGNVLVRAAQEGSFALDKVPDGLAEFQKLLLDEVTPQAQDAFNALGLSSWDYRTRIVKGGEDAKVAFGEILTEMSKLDQAGRNRVAFGLFGTPGEDVGADKLLASLMPSESSLGELDGRAKELGERMSDQVGRGWEKAWRKQENDLQRGWGRLLEDPGKSAQVLIEGSNEAILNFGKSAVDTVSGVHGEILGLAGGAVEQIEGVMGEVPGWLGGVWEQIEDGAGKIPEGLGAAFEGLEAIFTEPFKSAWNVIAGWYDGVAFPTIGPWDIDAGILGSYTIGPYGGWDLGSLPAFHSGGDVRAPGGGEVVARLLDGERVLNRSEAEDYRRGGGGQAAPRVTINVNGSVMAERDLLRTVETGLRKSARARR